MAEQICNRHFAVGQHLLLIAGFNVGVEVLGQLFGRLEGGHPNCAVVPEIDECGGHLSEVPELEGTFAETAAGDDRDGVGDTPVDFDKGDEAFAVDSARVRYFQQR